jgi:putative spermidine/putrescine transport system ATP-binding protein/spermidine/putrescine transport system ATP-binding protein
LGAQAVAQNQLEAIVQEIIYAGAVSTFLLTGPDGSALKVFAQNREARRPEPGSRVILAWSPADTILLED